MKKPHFAINALRFLKTAALCLALPAAAGASAFETPEYFASRGLDLINAAAAYEKGFTGKGVTIGISDDPSNFTSPEFSTKRNSSYVPNFYPTYEDVDGTVYSVEDAEYWSIFTHGIHVAGIAAASRNELGMHGVAFDAEVSSSVFYEKRYWAGGGHLWSDWAKAFLDDPTIRALNCSWGGPIFATEIFGENATMTDYFSWLMEGKGMRELAEVLNSKTAEKDTLFVFAAGNFGYEMPEYESTMHWLAGRNASTHVLSVVALEDKDHLKKYGGGFEGKNVVSWFSDLAAFNEDSTIAAPGYEIVGPNANFASDGEVDISWSGTSYAAPFVTGAAALVQQAYPWMKVKQIGDVLLSTANPNVTSEVGYAVTIQDDGETYCLNVFYFDGTPRTLEQQKEDCLDFLLQDSYAAELAYNLVESPICAHYNVPMEELIGQGVLDAGKAVDGPGALNARRLEKSDISDAYTVNGKKEKQALYAVDTQGYDSTWANDIKEVRVGLLAVDSAEDDLRRRYAYYKSNWLDRTHFDSGEPVVGAWFVRAYIDFYNDNVRASGLNGLHVGLLKTGEGRLTLTGNNTYQGASIVKQGALAINGFVAGDAYSVEQGTIAGRGTIGGTLYNKNVAVAGDAEGNGNLTMNQLRSSGELVSQYKNGNNTQFIVKGAAEIDGSTPRIIGTTPLPGDKFDILKAASIEGDTRIPAGTLYEVSAMMSAKNEISGGTLSLSFFAANNLNTTDPTQNETFAAMASMYSNLRNADDPRYSQMNPLFTMDATTAKESLSAIGSKMAVKSMAVAQRSDVAGHVLSSRLTETTAGANDFWAKFGKSWGHLRHNTNAHSSTALLGWDRKVSPYWRAGVFAEYGRTNLSDKTAGSEVREQRFGFYADHVKGKNETMLFVDYGWMRTKLHRSIAPLGLKADATYNSQILEFGGEYRYDLHAGTDSPWHVRPFVNAQLSRLWQNGYKETGAGVFGHEAQNAHNDYFAAGAGIEFKRTTKNGDLAIRLGLRHAFAGAEPKLRFNYVGDSANYYDMREAQDKTHFVCSLGGEARFAHGWSVAGAASLTRGPHDKEWSCALTVRKSW